MRRSQAVRRIGAALRQKIERGRDARIPRSSDNSRNQYCNNRFGRGVASPISLSV